MDADRWSRIEQLYHEASALTGADREAFLARACGEDRSLRTEIESLLAEDREGMTFFDEPALAVAAKLVSDEIPVLTGRPFGPYRIEELLGAGGMGDVYRAHDTVLGRNVAIKILPEAFNDDPERLARFKQEAQFLASLSHPNIAAIYGVHEANGLRGLVLELVDGETLRQRIARGPIPLYDAMRIARQIGEGLDAAHQRGIVHRDLKPSNIKIAKDGTVKILDFGLAKSAGVETPNDVRPDSVSGEPGSAVLGTASYMSPEQARGDLVDKRTDIWAFGCVCFEMLTGQPALRKKVMGSAGDEAGPRFDLMPPAVPAGVTAALKRCLDQDPKHRRRDIGDVLIDLDEALRPAPSRREARSPMPVMVAGLLLLTAVVAALYFSRPRESAPPASSSQSRLSLNLPPGMDFPEQDSQLAVSSDGMSVAYVAASGGGAARLFLRRLDGSEQMVGDALNVRHPFFSPDNKWIGFFAGDTLSKVSLQDHRVTAISPAHRGGFASWSHGSIVFGEGGDRPTGGIRRVSDNGGPVTVLSMPNRAAGETNHDAPQLLPDGKTLIYTVRSAYQNEGTHNLVVQPPGEAARVLVANARFGQLVGNSTLVYQLGNSLYATRFDPQTLTVSGPGVMLFDNLSPSPRWSVGGGVLVYRPRNEDRRLVWVTRGEGEEISIPSDPKRYAAPHLSPRGDRIAVDIAEDQKLDVWTFEIERQRLKPLTSDGASRYPMWTPDGKHVAMVQRREKRLYWQPPDGGPTHDLVRAAPFDVWIGSWTPDGRTLVYMQEGEGTQSDLWAVDIDSKEPARELVRTQAREYGGRLSPDGRWLAYFSDESGRFELYLKPFAGGSPRQISTGQDQAAPEEAVWAKDGSGELFYRQGAEMLSIRVSLDTGKPTGPPKVLFEGDYYAYGGPGIVNYDVSADGQRFLMLKPVEERTPNLTIVQGLDSLVRARLNP